MPIRDITTNLPYVPGVHLAFDHHDSELERLEETAPNHVISAEAASAARVVYDHFGGATRFPGISEELMAAVGKSIVDRTSPVDVGALMLEHGGGHTAAGTCQIDNERAAEVQAELIARLATR
jgi:nanoRNase/pAp phosphatase (c-di-AMP/oligoRNAs hydrolase)